MSYNNSVTTLTRTATPDPFMVYAHGEYYLTFTSGDHVEIWSSPTLADFENRKTVHQIWRPPPNTTHSADIWAPELHALGNRWYIYVACANPSQGNSSHRMYVIGGPPSHLPPTTGGPQAWQFLGPVEGLPGDQWAIDATVFPLRTGSDREEWFMCYSGWPYGDFRDKCQQLFITRLTSPTTTSAASPANPSGKPVAISTPTNSWEISDGDHGVNEGPQFLSGGQGWQGVVFSCAGSWTNEYKMGMLHYLPGSDPLDPASWRKDDRPLIQTAQGGNGPFGPGHGSFINVDGEVLGVYHATDGIADGWANRRARIQRVVFGPQGPWMGGVVGSHVSDFEGFAAGNMTLLGVQGGGLVQGQQGQQGYQGGQQQFMGQQNQSMEQGYGRQSQGQYQQNVTPGQQGGQAQGHHKGGFRGFLHSAGERLKEL